MMERAFSGFVALPEPTTNKWWEVLGISKNASGNEKKAARNKLAKIYHPDNGTHPNPIKMADINRAFEERSRLN